MQYTEDELEMRYQIVRSAIGSQRLEGLEPDPEVVEDLKRVVRGEITTDDIRKKILAKLRNNQQ